MPAGPLRLVIVDDYEVVVAGLAQMLEPFAARVEVVELTAGAASTAPADVALYDSFAQPAGGERSYADVLTDTRARHLAVYSWNLQQRLIDHAIAGGVSGYLAKSLGAADLVAALERIADGETVIAPERDTEEAEEGSWPGKAQGLTARESEIIALIAQGLSNQEIADRTFLSINSVKSYIRSSYRKMGVDSRSRAVLWGIERGFRADRVRIRPPHEPG